jgi:hypothetical protein
VIVYVAVVALLVARKEGEIVANQRLNDLSHAATARRAWASPLAGRER